MGDPRMETPTGRIVASWLQTDSRNKSMFRKNLHVWTNGYVSPATLNPINYEADMAGGFLGWKELYEQREVVAKLSDQLSNITDTSHSEYTFEPFATFPRLAPSGPYNQQQIKPREFAELMGIIPEVQPWSVACCCDGCDKVLSDALNFLRRHTIHVQQLSVSVGSWVAYPTFIVGQRPDGTLIGVCSTEISV